MLRIDRDDRQEFPGDFFYRYMCANHDEIKKVDNKWLFWQTGMILANGRTNALVELVENRGIDITVWGKDKRVYYNKLESRIDALLKDYPFSQEKEKKTRKGKVITTIILILEAVSTGVSKGVAKAFFEGKDSNLIS